MDIRSSIDGLRSLLGVSQSSSSPSIQSQGSTSQASGAGSLGVDRATLSQAGSEVSDSISDSGVRSDRVASIQRALAAGSYSVPSSAVASKVIDSMLTAGR